MATDEKTVTYPKEAYNPVMDYYKTIPENLKSKAKDILTSFTTGKYKDEGSAPPNEMLASLKALVAKEGNLESRVNGASQSWVSKVIQGVGERVYKFIEGVYNPGNILKYVR